MKFKFWFTIACIFFFGYTASYAQNANLKKVSDDNWIEYLVPKFMNDVTNYKTNMSPHSVRYDYVSGDKRVKISILVNNSTNPRKEFQYNLEKSYNGILSRKDLMVEYKVLKSNKYFISGYYTNGQILYQFANAKDGFGYTYSILYDTSYKAFFDKTLNDIIKGFKILQGNDTYE